MICLVLVLFTPSKLSLVFYQENTNEIAAYLPVQTASKFNIIWTHSIHLKDVIEKYEVTEDQQIHQYEIVYEEFGIGMPSNAQEGERFVHENGKYHIKDLHNYFADMNIRNGKTVSEHRLQWGENAEHQIYLNDFFDPGAWFKVKVKKISLLDSWKEVKLHD